MAPSSVMPQVLPAELVPPVPLQAVNHLAVSLQAATGIREVLVCQDPAQSVNSSSSFEGILAGMVCNVTGSTVPVLLLVTIQ